MVVAEDPSVPEISTVADPVHPSLYRDISSIINGLTGALSTHPELSEGFRNLIRNASNGAYWDVEREAATAIATAAATEAAEDTVRSVVGAIDGFIRALVPPPQIPQLPQLPQISQTPDAPHVTLYRKGERSLSVATRRPLVAA